MDFFDVIEKYTPKRDDVAERPVSEPPVSTAEASLHVTDAEIYKKIGDVLENVWLALTENMTRSYLLPEQVPEWVETLQWAIKVMPEGYERQRDIIQEELRTYQTQLT